MKKLLIAAVLIGSAASAAEARTSKENRCWVTMPGLGFSGITWFIQCAAVNNPGHGM